MYSSAFPPILFLGGKECKQNNYSEWAGWFSVAGLCAYENEVDKAKPN